jgi:predicted nuclease with TOPRIM domain
MIKNTIYYCPQCCEQNKFGSTFCGRCGIKLPTSQIEYINSITQFNRNLINQKYDLKHDISRLSTHFEELKAEKLKYEKDIETLESIFTELLERLDKLQIENAIHDFGFYSPRYNFESSEIYRLRLEQIRERQKELLRAKGDAKCLVEWSVEGSRVRGRKQTNDILKLMLFAFNGEADVRISKVKYNNVRETERRIKKSFDLINKMGSVQQCYITPDYLNLKLEELFLAHEYQEKLFEEKEEQRRIREQMREDEVARREIEKALSQAEREEARYEDALKKVREEVEQAAGEKQAKLLAQIEILQNKLKEVYANKERAMSRAQMTRSGHVYVISNIGSFGENVYKIGMTRRLDPMDRVIELGDASVPFRFDAHAIIYSDDAPTLEAQLHKKFNYLRINQVNNRKEFFRVTLKAIAEAVREFHGEIEFTRVAEAMEYRKTLAFREGQGSESIYQDILEV